MENVHKLPTLNRKDTIDFIVPSSNILVLKSENAEEFIEAVKKTFTDKYVNVCFIKDNEWVWLGQDQLCLPHYLFDGASEKPWGVNISATEDWTINYPIHYGDRVAFVEGTLWSSGQQWEHDRTGRIEPEKMGNPFLDISEKLLRPY